MHRHPPRRKGKRDSVQVCAAAWLDLLGYGAMLRAVNFDPRAQAALDAVRRLHTFHAVCLTHEARGFFPIVLLNDGVASFRDLPVRSTSVACDFLQRSVALYRSVNEADRAAGHPGARMVLAVGFRIRGKRLGKDSARVNSILSRVQSGAISARQGIHEAARGRPDGSLVPDLEANFAFTRAFLADHGGTKEGLAGPECFMDMALFQEPPPAWITFSRKVPWRTDGMATTFGQVAVLDVEAAGRSRQSGINTTHQIATALEATARPLPDQGDRPPRGTSVA